MTVDYGKNFSMESLRRMRRFYLLFPIRSAVQTELSWSHYRELLQIKDEHIIVQKILDKVDFKLEVVSIACSI